MTITRSAAALAAAACLAVLTSCASHAAAPGAGATRSPSTSTTAPAPPPASTPATPALATTAPGGRASAPRCHTSQLSLAFTGFNEASGGQRGITLILTNHSGTTCHVYGYPKVAACTGAASQKWEIGQVSANDFGPITNAGTGTVLSCPRGSIADGTPLVMGLGTGDQSTPWHVSFHHYLTGG
jgi:hypothetical protein